MSSFDVYSYGVVSSSTLYVFKGDFPSADGYAEIDDVQYMVGGEAANSSIVLSRLGASVKLDGNWLGDDARGRRTKSLLEGYGIDTSRIPLREGYDGVLEALFSAQGSRTIFGTYGQLQEDEAWNTPNPEDIEAATVVCLDPFFKAASLRAAEIASELGKPVITVDSPFDDPLLNHVSAIVVSDNYIHEHYPDHDPEELFESYLDATGGLVVFTFGEKEAWYGRPGEAIRKHASYTVDAVDTSAAGDSFRAAVVFGFLQAWDDAKIIDFAAATAAIVCTRYPGALNSPSLDEVTDFIKSIG